MTTVRSRSTPHNVRVVLVVAVIAVATTACIPGAPAVSNGRLPDSMLTTISPACRIANEIEPQLQAMLSTAWTQGIALMPERSSYLPPGVSAPEITACYRSYDMQVWWRNWYCFIGSCGMAAVPGTSKHGWGRAVDFEDQGGQMNFSSPGYTWLAANAASYGFYQPASSGPFGANPEAWHWVHD